MQTAPLSERLDALARQFADKAWAVDARAVTPSEAELRQFLRDHAASLSGFAREARQIEIPDGDGITSAQRIAVARMIGNLPFTIAVGPRTFDLPDGYVTFRRDYRGDQSIYGGISADGEVST